MQSQQLNRGNRRVLADRSIGARLICRPAQRCRASVAARSADKFDAQVAVVLGTQWGDEGKGKLVDILAQQYDIVARAQVRRGALCMRPNPCTAIVFAISSRQAGHSPRGSSSSSVAWPAQPPCRRPNTNQVQLSAWNGVERAKRLGRVSCLA